MRVERKNRKRDIPYTLDEGIEPELQQETPDEDYPPFESSDNWNREEVPF